MTESEVRNKIDLLIREIDPTQKNGRYLRENLRRIKNYLDDLSLGVITAIENTTVTVNVNNADIAAATVYETQDCTGDGQTAFTLTFTPVDGTKVRMTINGAEMRNGSDFTVSGTAVTFDDVTAGFALELSNEFGDPDRIIFEYTKA